MCHVILKKNGVGYKRRIFHGLFSESLYLSFMILRHLQFLRKLQDIQMPEFCNPYKGKFLE